MSGEFPHACPRQRLAGTLLGLLATGLAGADLRAQLEVDFAATPVRGPVPLTVDFTDQTTGGTPAAWEWSFGVFGADSEAQDPQYTYEVPGTYTVALTVSAGGQVASTVRHGLIVVDPVPLSADFAASVTSGALPLEVSFEGAWQGTPPTAWSWSFGDGNASTEQDPVHTYTTPGEYTVTLEVFVAGQAAVVERADLIDVAYPSRLDVPGDHGTIQAAIDAAAEFTEILVAPGVYREAVDFGGKTLALVGCAGAGETVIEAPRAGSRPVTIPFGSGQGTVLRGFTITGGELVDDSGGGVYVDFGTPARVRECVIVGNACHGLGSGGGVFGGPNASVEDCLVTNNATTGSGDGGGVMFARVLRCALVDNSSLEGGGGALSEYVVDSVIARNRAGWGGGVGYSGPGIPDYRGSLFEENEAETGGGLRVACLLVCAQPPALEGAAFVSNRATAGGGAIVLDAPVVLPGARTGLGRVVTRGNTEPAVEIMLGSVNAPAVDVDLEQVTLIDDGVRIENAPTHPPPSRRVTVRNAILVGAADPIRTEPTSWDVVVTYSDVEGGFPGEGNIDQDPLLVDPEHLAFGPLPNSPAVDAGDPESPPDPDGSRADMGAIPLMRWLELWRALSGVRGLPRLTGEGTLTPGARTALGLSRARAGAPATLVLGFSAQSLPFAGGVLVPTADKVLLDVTDASGAIDAIFRWPDGLPAGTTTYFQWWIEDGAAPAGFAASNARSGTTP